MALARPSPRPVTPTLYGLSAGAEILILECNSHRLVLKMPGLITQEDGEDVGPVSATSTSRVLTPKQSHISVPIPHDPTNLARYEETKNPLISTTVSDSHPPIAQTRAGLQPPLFSPYTSAPVTLLVGGPASPSREAEPVSFYVHADLLTSISPFFRAAFNSSSTDGCKGYGFQESQTRTMTLPEERPDDIRYLLQWVYRKAAMSTMYPSTLSSTSGPAWPSKPFCPIRQSFSRGSTGSGVSVEAGPHAGALWHSLVDPPLHALRKYNAERLVVSKAAVHGDISQLTVPRPTPPAFGPLIRLWLLAERLGVLGGLSDDIVERVMVVARLGNCVPGREDVWLLWEGMEGSENLRGKLRELVLDQYIGMRCWGLFEEEGENDPWHGGFLQDLVKRLMWEVHGDWKGRTVQRNAAEESSRKGLEDGFGRMTVGKEGENAAETEGEDEDEAEGEGEFVFVGKLRRRRCGYHEHS